MTTDQYETIRIEQEGAVLLIRLDRPDALNALSQQLVGELMNALQAYEGDPDLRCAVLTGDERAFAAGADIKQIADKDFAGAFAEDLFANLGRIAELRKPIIAAVAGFALGGGCELAMVCDFIIAADTAKFGQPEVKLAVAPGIGGTQRLARAVGKAKAMDMCISGRLMDVAEAERSGLVSRVVPAADLIDEALRAAAEIAALPPLAVQANKEMVNVAFETALAQGLLFERRLFQALFSTADKTEGMAAFVEKRAAKWSGR